MSQTDLGNGRTHLPSVYEAWSQVTCLNGQQRCSDTKLLHNAMSSKSERYMSNFGYQGLQVYMFCHQLKNSHKRDTLICWENTNTLVILRNYDIISLMAQQPHLYLIYYHQMGSGICLAPVTVPNHLHVDINVHRKPNLTTSSSSSP